MDTNKSIKVCLMGFTPKGANGVEYFIRKHAQAKYHIRVVDQSVDDAIILVDGDTIDGQVFLTDVKNASHKVILAKFKEDKNSPLPWLMKPIIPDELINKLIVVSNQKKQKSVLPEKKQNKDSNHKKLFSALSSDQLQHLQRDHPQSVPTESVNFYQPNQYLQGVIIRCIAKGTSQQPWVQAHLPFGDVVIDNKNKLVYLLIGNKHIRPYEKLKLTQSVMIRTLTDYQNVIDMVKPGQVMLLDDLLWDLSIAASFGRLPIGTDVDQPMKMTHWPNLTRIRCFDHATQIAALWSQNRMSIRSVIEQLNIGHNFVYVFYAAAQSLGLMVENQGKIVNLKGNSVADRKQQSIMSRLLSHIRMAS